MLISIPDKLIPQTGRCDSHADTLTAELLGWAGRSQRVGAQAIQRELDKRARVLDAYGMSIDPGDKGAVCVWRKHCVVAVEAVSTYRDRDAYKTIDAICQQYHVQQAWIEDQFLWSGKLIALVRNSGIWQACLYRYGCTVLEWVQPRKWQAWRDQYHLGTGGYQSHVLAAYHIGMYGQRLSAG
jgi:hypothetical protein